MSAIPISCFILAPLLLWGLFTWHTVAFLLLLLIAFVVGALLVCELPTSDQHWAFLLFILTEVCLFVAFLHSCSWFFSSDLESVSDSLELPFVGCFLLLGSSISITGFHHILGWEHSSLLLVLTAVLGIGFILLQLIEFSEAIVGFSWNGFYSASLATIGLHFSHVGVGVLLMCLLLWLGPPRSGVHYCTLLTWYWHFVDYIWLLVYALVYVC
nr:cytochrome c oxidase subunit 3 [Caryophyllaeus brachycollis]